MRLLKRISILLALLIPFAANAQEKTPPHIMLVMHGGAGTITRGSMTTNGAAALMGSR